MTNRRSHEQIKAETELEYVYFDALPKEIREFIANSPFAYSSREVWHLFRQRGAYDALMDLKEWEQRTLEDLRKKATYGA